MEGPAGGRPCMSAPAVLPVRTKLMITSSAWACRRDGAWKYSPAAAVPVSIKMPEPMMAPIPSAVSDQGPNDLLSRFSGFSESEISLSMDLQQKSWLSEVRMVAAGSVDGSDKRLWSPGLSSRLSAVSYQIKTCVASRRERASRPLPHEFCNCLYRFAWPRASFFTFGFFDPRA